MRRSTLYWLLGLTALVFGRAVFMDYVSWDDNVLIQDNVILRMPFGEALRASFGGFYHGDYIPLVLMSFWTDLKLLGWGAHGQHAVNLLLHLVNVALLYRVLMGFRLGITPALFVCLVFALHPAQAESVLWVSERKGLLSTMFLLGAILASERATLGARERRVAWSFAYVASYGLAFLAKATGLLLPIFLAWVDRAQNKLSRRAVCLKHGPVLALGGVATWVRIVAYRTMMPTLAQESSDLSRLWGWPREALAAIGFYARLFVWPARLSIIYPAYSDVGVWGFYAVVGGVALGLVAFVWRRTREPWILGFALWSFLMLVPVLQIVPRINFVNDRYLYLPLIGFAGIAVMGIGHLFGRVPDVRFTWLVWVLVAAPLGVLSIARADVWSSNLKLWRDTIRRNPDNGLAHNNLAAAYQSTGDLDRAIAEFELAVRTGMQDGTAYLAYNNLGNIYSTPELPNYFNLARAVDYLKRGIAAAEWPSDTIPLRYNLALVYGRMNERAAALSTLMELRELIRQSDNERYLGLAAKVDDLISQIR